MLKTDLSGRLRQHFSPLSSFVYSRRSKARSRKGILRGRWIRISDRKMDRRNINPVIFPPASRDNLFSTITHQSPLQFHGNTQENVHFVAQRLAWLGDQIESRRALGHGANLPRLVGRSLAAAGDNINCRYNPLTRRNQTLLRLLWRGFSEQDEGGLVFAGALLQVCYLVLQQVSRNML